MKIIKKPIQNNWDEYIMTNGKGMEIHFLNFGGIITRIYTPDQEGNVENVVLGYKDYQDYLHNEDFFGAIIGRVAGRIKNASFQLKVENYTLENNDGDHHLHGGSQSFHNTLWEVKTFKNSKEVGAKLSYMSPHMENGHPGNLKVLVTYWLIKQNEFIIDYKAKTDQDTIIALTNHSYFNLSGNNKDTIENHHFSLSSSEFLELDDTLTPTRNVIPVKDTAFDLQEGDYLKAGISSDHLQNKIIDQGYDHHFLFNKKKDQVKVTEEKSGRSLSISSTHPGLTLYTANTLGKQHILDHEKSKAYMGVCLETQEHPASLYMEQLPSVVLKKDDVYEKQTVFRFGSVIS